MFPTFRRYPAYSNQQLSVLNVMSCLQLFNLESLKLHAYWKLTEVIQNTDCHSLKIFVLEESQAVSHLFYITDNKPCCPYCLLCPCVPTVSSAIVSLLSLISLLSLVSLVFLLFLCLWCPRCLWYRSFIFHMFVVFLICGLGPEHMREWEPT